MIKNQNEIKEIKLNPEEFNINSIYYFLVVAAFIAAIIIYTAYRKTNFKNKSFIFRYYKTLVGLFVITIFFGLLYVNIHNLIDMY